jgi:hypothetical protein
MARYSAILTLLTMRRHKGTECVCFMLRDVNAEHTASLKGLTMMGEGVMIFSVFDATYVQRSRNENVNDDDDEKRKR